MDDLVIQITNLWNDAYKKDDTFHMQMIESCVNESFTDFGINIFNKYIEGRKMLDVDFLIKVAADNDIKRLTDIKGIGEKIANAIIKAFSSEEVLTMIFELRNAGLNFREDS